MQIHAITYTNSIFLRCSLSSCYLGSYLFNVTVYIIKGLLCQDINKLAMSYHIMEFYVTTIIASLVWHVPQSSAHITILISYLAQNMIKHANILKPKNASCKGYSLLYKSEFQHSLNQLTSTGAQQQFNYDDQLLHLTTQLLRFQLAAQKQSNEVFNLTVLQICVQATM